MIIQTMLHAGDKHALCLSTVELTGEQNASLLFHHPFIVVKDSKKYDPAAIKILDIKVQMLGIVTEM